VKHHVELAGGPRGLIGLPTTASKSIAASSVSLHPMPIRYASVN
jgi:hypothetical protein